MLSIRVLVASHILPYREGLERTLRESPEFILVGGAGSSVEAIEQIHKIGVDVVLLDMAMSGAVSVAKEGMHGERPSKIVALGMPGDEAEVLVCARLGIAGYVMRDGATVDVIAAIKAAARGEVHCSPKVAGSLFRRIAAVSTQRAQRTQRTGNGTLTAREAQILTLVQQGMSNKMIAGVLGIELTTVKNHVHNILVKLDIHRRAEAISLLNRSASERDVIGRN
ncbi:MAG TPA: response regulator transcription factor [Steroidobacteraceae bacterium]